jgi:predicted esterase YcpF (UPF0227 family)
MEIGEYRYKKTELLKLSEEIYQYKGRKQQLELELFSEQFHRRYIPKRKEMLNRRVWNNRPILIVASILFLASLTVIIPAFKYGRAPGFPLLISLLLFVFIPKNTYKMFIEQHKMKVKLKKSTNKEKAIRYAEKKDVDTLEVDDMKNKQRIEELVAEIEELDKKIEELENIRYEYVQEAKKKNTYDETWEATANKEKPENAAGLNLKANFDDVFDIKELFAYYTTAENYVIKNIDDLNIRLKNVNKSITKVDDDFDHSKSIVLIYIVFLVVAGFSQLLFEGALLNVYCIARLIVSFAGLIFVDRYIKNPILFYLIENESSFVDEYVFVNDIVPIRFKDRT